MTNFSVISLFQLSVTLSESNHSSRPLRSSSLTRPSLSSSYNSYSSNRGTSILNTSSASVSSYTRPSSPITRSPSTARPSTARSTPSRSSTPSKVRPSSTSSYIDKSQPSQSSRPSTPTSRPQIPAKLNSTYVRSRPSTPTRWNPVPSLSSAAGASSSAGRIVSNGHSAAPASRSSSPGPRVQPPQRPVVPPEFPLDTPPNLRTTLPDRPISAGRSRPGGSVTMKANQDTTSSVNMPRRHSSPIVTRGRLTEPSRPGGSVTKANQDTTSSVNMPRLTEPSRPGGSVTKANQDTTSSVNMPRRHLSPIVTRGRLTEPSRPGGSVTKANQDTTSSVNMPRRHLSPIVTRGRLTEPPGKTRVHSNGHASDIHESRKTSHVSDLAMRKPVKSSTTTADGMGFGRTISKNSLDMALRHMKIRNGTGSIRSLSGTTLFPQSIRSASAKTQSIRSLSASDSVNSSGSPGSLKNGDFSENGNSISRPAENGSDSHDGRFSAKSSEVDIYESSRYDAILLKEDLKNTTWLHSIDDKSDQGFIFDNGFEPLPEPFGLL
ncbi:hypothetical protein CRYUN_Cryun36dG0002300 [Craigia yunnanensis]